MKEGMIYMYECMYICIGLGLPMGSGRLELVWQGDDSGAQLRRVRDGSSSPPRPIGRIVQRYLHVCMYVLLKYDS